MYVRYNIDVKTRNLVVQGSSVFIGDRPYQVALLIDVKFPPFRLQCRFKQTKILMDTSHLHFPGKVNVHCVNDSGGVR